MFYVEEQAIYLTRGDSAEVSIDLTTEGGENYELGADDTLTLTVRKEPTATSAVIFAKTVTGSGVISITPEDTRDAEIGQYSAGGHALVISRDGGLHDASTAYNQATLKLVNLGGTKGVVIEGLDALIINSSTSGSTKKFKITVDDAGTISATEVTT